MNIGEEQPPIKVPEPVVVPNQEPKEQPKVPEKVPARDITSNPTEIIEDPLSEHLNWEWI